MQLKIILNKNNLFVIKLKREDAEGTYSRKLQDLIMYNYNSICNEGCFVKHMTIYSYKLENIKKVKEKLESLIFQQKLKGEI